MSRSFESAPTAAAVAVAAVLPTADIALVKEWINDGADGLVVP